MTEFLRLARLFAQPQIPERILLSAVDLMSDVWFFPPGSRQVGHRFVLISGTVAPSDASYDGVHGTHHPSMVQVANVGL